MENHNTVQNEVRSRLIRVRQAIDQATVRSGRPTGSVTLVAVTKTVPFELVPALKWLDLTDCGENRPQELARRQVLWPEVRWHLIGHLQRNKVPQALAHAGLIHSIDSIRLLEEVEKEAAKKGQSARILLQVNGSREPQKGGFEPEELPTFVPRLNSLKNTRIEGLMTMAAFTEDPETTRPTFQLVRTLASELKPMLDPNRHTMDQLSMGMSGDYEVAIEEGATLVRVGSALFEGLAP